jgi:hypothetical protein
MKIFLIVLGIAFAFVALTSVQAADSPGKQTKLQHIVLLKFKEGTGTDQIKKVETAFRGLKSKIPEITALEWGTNNSPEQKNKGFTHCFVLTFKSEKDRETYLPHPAHKAFGQVLGAVLGDVLVIDFWAQD